MHHVRAVMMKRTAGPILGLVTAVTVGACSEEHVGTMAVQSPAQPSTVSFNCPLSRLRGVHAGVVDLRGGVTIVFEGPDRTVALLRGNVHAMAAAGARAGNPFVVCPCGGGDQENSARASLPVPRDLGVTSMQGPSSTGPLPPAAATVNDTPRGATLVLTATDPANTDALRIAARQEVSAMAGCLTVSLGEGPSRPACFPGQIRIEDFCVDKYEAYVVELDEHGDESPHSPYAVVDGLRVRAKVAPNVVPQAYISEVQASEACANAGKGLCTADQFLRACRGPDKTAIYPYGGRQRAKGVCNEGKGSFVALRFGQDAKQWTYANFNDPLLDQAEGGLARTGAFDGCASPDGVFDMVGNLDEWVDEPGDLGHFRGGWYGDAENNGPGCTYVTSAHERTYHDYTTGFRCCALATD
jgi:hypothetical protein